MRYLATPTCLNSLVRTVHVERLSGSWLGEHRALTQREPLPLPANRVPACDTVCLLALERPQVDRTPCGFLQTCREPVRLSGAVRRLLVWASVRMTCVIVTVGNDRGMARGTAPMRGYARLQENTVARARALVEGQHSRRSFVQASRRPLWTMSARSAIRRRPALVR